MEPLKKPSAMTEAMKVLHTKLVQAKELAAQQRPKLHQVKPKSSKEDLATDFLLGALAMLEEADKISQFKTIDIQSAIERGIAQKATTMMANKI